MIKSLQKTKEGAASFYIVAFSTLILVIIAAGFATAVINEIIRTSNDDLSQSAYDSAMAGVEEAKLAYMNYKRCLEAGGHAEEPTGNGAVTCGNIIWWMMPKNKDCYMVGHILGRIDKNIKYENDKTQEVIISDTVAGNNNNLQQAYTCVEIDTELNDYRATLSSTNNSKVVKVELTDGINGLDAKDIKTMKIKWFSRSDQTTEFNFSNVVSSNSLGGNNWRVAFLPADNVKVAVPPVISLQMVQTSNRFIMDDFTTVERAAKRTDRATLVMVPTNDADKADASKYGTSDDAQWLGAYNTSKSTNYFQAGWLVDSNLAGTGVNGNRNLPYLVYCSDDSNSEFACEATIELPDPIGGDRADDTFMFVVSLPYSQPDTEFSLEFYCAADSLCNSITSGVGGDSNNDNLATQAGVEIRIDSTGRANDLFRRVETRLESANMGFAYPLYGIQLLGKNKNDTLLNKDIKGVITEYSAGTYDSYLNQINSRRN